jgi:dTDP-4-amino-4,6-dideoxygalactose transaminase
MKIPFLDLKLQYLNLKDEIDKSIAEVIDQTSFIGGEQVSKFANEFSSSYGVEKTVPLANGTDALYIAMKMLGIGPGDEVITTATSWISTSETISQTGAKPVFVDIDEYFTIDARKIESQINKNTKAIIPVHLYGQMCDMNEIMRISLKYNISVIEDCAQSHFSELDNKLAGSWGKCGTFSFYPGKNLGAFGDAGTLITNDIDFAEKCRIYASHGAPVKHNHIMEGINSRMDTIQAAVLRVKLNHIKNWTESRIEISNIYMNLLSDIDEIELPMVRSNSKHTFHVFAIRTSMRDELKSYLKERGIPSQIHYPFAMPFMPAYKDHHQDKTLFVNAKLHQETELSLPIFPEMTKEQVEYVSTIIHDFFKKTII